MTDAVLFGFAAQLEGNEDRVFLADPAVRIGDRDYVVQGDLWTEETLVPIAPGQERFLHLFEGHELLRIHEGQRLMVAGSSFIQDIAKQGSLVALNRRLRTWRIMRRRGFSWALGSRRDLSELKNGAAAILERDLHAGLSDSLEGSFVDIDKVFRLYRELAGEQSHPQDQLRYLTNLALYFREKNDGRGERLMSRRAVAGGLAGSASSFDAEVETLVVRLRREKLSTIADKMAPRERLSERNVGVKRFVWRDSQRHRPEYNEAGWLPFEQLQNLPPVLDASLLDRGHGRHDA